MGRLVNKQAVDKHVQCQLSASVYQCIWRKAAEELFMEASMNKTDTYHQLVIGHSTSGLNG